MTTGDLDRKRTVQLTTRGRTSGQPRTVQIWFVLAEPNAVWVQHSSRAPAQWYRNLLAEPGVSLDFGDGPIPGRAEPITDPRRIREVLRRVRRKYPYAWLFQLLGWNRQPVAARITFAA